MTLRPLHPVEQMTTHELAGYRRNLERAIGPEVVGEEPAETRLLRTRLDAVLAEEEDRRRIASTGSYGYPSL